MKIKNKGLASKPVNERKGFMQETQHTLQTATRTTQNQDNMDVNGYKNTEDTHKQTNIY